MFKKIYDYIKHFIIENLQPIIIIVVFYILSIIPLPYYIYTGGGILDIEDKVTLSEEKQNDSSYNFAYVSSMQATPVHFLLSFIMPGWDLEEIATSKANEEETAEDIQNRNIIAINSSTQTALKLAYEKADKEFKIIETNFHLQYISDESNTNLKVGDQILTVNNHELKDINHYREIVQSKEVGEVLTLEVLRDDKNYQKEIEVIEIDGEKKTGISLVEIYDYETNPPVEINYNTNESGPSGGFMLALFVYNRLLDEPLVNDLKIVGTGTIDEYGNVGSIGGVKYKLAGAISSQADIFFVPSGDNYEECKEYLKDEDYTIKVVPVETLDEAIDYLGTLQ